MAMFNFDSESNIISNKIPAAKAINKNFCRKKGAGIWIADDNMIACGWTRNCSDDCSDDCVEHFKDTAPHCVMSSEEEISGRGIINPRICVIRRTKLLRLTDKGVFAGFWVKGDGEIKDEKGVKKYTCARRYLLMFLDQNNEPLHKDPIQLTAKGTFQVEFDSNLIKFRDDIKKAYAKSMKRRSGSMNELWYAMCVFVPTFESKMVGKAGFQSLACAVKSYLVPTEDDWLTLCVGRNIKVNEIINLTFNESESWINKFNNQKDIIFDDNFSSVSGGS